MLRLYDSRYSGNAWKVRILLRQLGIPFERITLDLAQGDAKSPYVSMAPDGGYYLGRFPSIKPWLERVRKTTGLGALA